MLKIPFDHTWFLYQEDKPQERYRAPVPGSVHDALRAAGAIPDAHYGYNEQQQKWVGDKVWIYENSFELSAQQLRLPFFDLVAEGMDTFCEIHINDQPVALTDNMFRSWRFPVRSLLREDINTIRLRFSPASAVMAAGTADFHLPAWSEPLHTGDWGQTGRGYVRKQACQFGWDWGYQAPSAGPYLPLYLHAYKRARIADWQQQQIHQPDGRVAIKLSIQPSCASPLRIRASISHANQLVASIEEPFTAGWEGRLDIPQPLLWWPNGMGNQPLYDLQLLLMDEDGSPLDRVECRLGLRTIELQRNRDSNGESMRFVVNGRPFFAKGCNWIPLDSDPSSDNLEPRYRALLEDAATANMNMIRVWGGGLFPHHFFYDLCDRMGLLVWQDLMFACGTYPTWDQRFLDSVWHEVVDNARRLRHHACLACWCGNNELESGFCNDRWIANSAETGPGKMAWSSYLELFERVIPSALTLADPHTPYLPGSPHSSGENRRNPDSPHCGDFHYWAQWFAGRPFAEARAQSHRFISEFGFQSLPQSATLQRYAPKDQPLQPDAPWLTFRQRSHPGNQRIINAVHQHFGEAATGDFTHFCTLSQITHGYMMQSAVEAWRASFPRCAGSLYWQLNDRWAAPTWATIDIDGNWKAGHFMMRRAFANVLICAIPDANPDLINIVVVNDLHEPVHGHVDATLSTADGQSVWQQSYPVDATAGGCLPTTVAQIAIDDISANLAPDSLILWLEFHPQSPDLCTAGCRNTYLPGLPRQLPLIAPTLQVHAHQGPAHGMAGLHIECSKGSALWVQLQSSIQGCRFSDNFFSLREGQSHTVHLLWPTQAGGLDKVIDSIHLTPALPLPKSK
jgi:beta-mannosidase